MKRFILFCLTLSLLAPVAAFAGGLDDFLASLNIQARANLPGFSAKISAQFGTPVPKVQAVIRSVQEPADAFMVFQLAQMSGKQPDTVMSVYAPNKKKGWGAIAKDLGIKPGSQEFFALKRGDLALTGQPAGERNYPGRGHGRGNGNGRGRGHGRGHNEDS